MERKSPYQFIETLPEDERNLLRAFREQNLRVAGDKNDFQPFGNFQKRATGNQTELRDWFEWETPNGKVWYIDKTMLGENRWLMKTSDFNSASVIWAQNVLVRLAHMEFPIPPRQPNRFASTKHQRMEDE